MSHYCHAHGCKKQVPPRMWGCAQHWFGLRKEIRDAIWREYQPGQEMRKDPSLRYLAVQQLAVAETAFKPNDGMAAYHAARYLQNALKFRAMAIEKGHGDPLEDLLDFSPVRPTPAEGGHDGQ